MDCMTAYAAATQVLKTLKDLASVGKALDTAELKLKIVRVKSRCPAWVYPSESAA
jgi:hypothetical protein